MLRVQECCAPECPEPRESRRNERCATAVGVDERRLEPSDRSPQRAQRVRVQPSALEGHRDRFEAPSTRRVEGGPVGIDGERDAKAVRRDALEQLEHMGRRAAHGTAAEHLEHPPRLSPRLSTVHADSDSPARPSQSILPGVAESGPAQRQQGIEQARAASAQSLVPDSLVPGSLVPVWKTLEDYVLGTALLLLALPILAATALAVRLGSPGPILFRQERLTLDGRRFAMLKFRTLPHGTRHEEEGGEIRTGRLGMFLRRTSLDELPQLWNVLRGEMSIVGPRPERPVFAQALEREIPGFARRTRVKAGITGWAQVHGLRGGTTELHRRVDYDLWYVDQHSLGLDLRIMAFTLTRFWNRAARRSHTPELEKRVLGERGKPRSNA